MGNPFIFFTGQPATYFSNMVIWGNTILIQLPIEGSFARQIATNTRHCVASKGAVEGEWGNGVGGGEVFYSLVCYGEELKA